MERNHQKATSTGCAEMLILLGKREELMLDKVVLKWEIETIHVPFIAVKNIWVEWAWAGEEQDCEV